MLLAYVSILHWALAANLLVVVLLLAWAFTARGRWRTFARVTVGVVTSVSVLFWGSIALFTGVKREMRFDMTWEYGQPVDACPGAKHVILRFKGYPDYAIGVCSADLGDYLEGRGGREVPVVFEVTRDFGRTRGFHEVQIGELRQWDACDGYASVAGDTAPPPFP